MSLCCFSLVVLTVFFVTVASEQKMRVRVETWERMKEKLVFFSQGNFLLYPNLILTSAILTRWHGKVFFFHLQLFQTSMPRPNSTRKDGLSGIKPTSASRVAPNSRDLLKDAIPTELHSRGIIWSLKIKVNQPPVTCWAEVKQAGDHYVLQARL